MGWRGAGEAGGRKFGRTPVHLILDYFRGACCRPAHGTRIGTKLPTESQRSITDYLADPNCGKLQMIAPEMCTGSCRISPSGFEPVTFGFGGHVRFGSGSDDQRDESPRFSGKHWRFMATGRLADDDCKSTRFFTLCNGFSDKTLT